MRLDDDAPADERQIAVTFEVRGSTHERPGCPPGVVVGERHDGRGRGPNADGAAGSAEVAAGGEQPNRGKRLSDGVGRPVAAPVVDHDDFGVVGEVLEPPERPQELVSTIPRDDDDGHSTIALLGSALLRHDLPP